MQNNGLEIQCETRLALVFSWVGVWGECVVVDSEVFALLTGEKRQPSGQAST